MRNRIFSRLASIINYSDVFSKSVSLVHASREKHSTNLGVLASLCLLAASFAYFVNTLVTPFEIDSSSNNTYNMTSSVISYKDILSMTNDSTLPNLFSPFLNENSTGIPLALGFSPGIDASVATMQVYLKQYPNGTSNPKLTQLPLSTCNSTLFPYSNWTEAVSKGINQFFCLTNNNISLDWRQDSIEIYVTKCTGSSCKAITSISNALYGGYIQFAFIEPNYDSYKGDTPVSQFIDFRYFSMIGPNTFAFSEIDIKLNKVQTFNGLNFSYFTPEMVVNQNQEITSNSNIVYKSVIKFSPLYNQYNQMQIYYTNPSSKRNLGVASGGKFISKFLFAICQAAGLYIVLFALANPLFAMYSSKLYANSVVNKIREFERVEVENAKPKRNLRNYEMIDQQFIDGEEEKHNAYLENKPHNEAVYLGNDVQHQMQFRQATPVAINYSAMLELALPVQDNNYNNPMVIIGRFKTEDRILNDFQKDREITKIICDIRYLK